jgi:hypothetical protein
VSSSAGGSSSAVRVGQVPDALLSSATAANLAVARTYADLSRAPTSPSRAQWYGDDPMTLGAGNPQEDGGPPRGASLLWVNADGTVRAEEIGANAVLQSEPGQIQEIVAAPARVSATSAQWDVVWVESDDGGGESLLYDELDCQ